MSIFPKNNVIHSKLAKKIITTLAFVFIFESLAFSAPIVAASGGENKQSEDKTSVAIEEEITDEEVVIKTKNNVKITAYNSLANQTDSSPCIAARGFNLCKHGIEDSIAANFLPMGAKVRIPELFGDRVFVVRDRMHQRFNNRVDIWMVKRSDALKFGIKTADIEIIQ